MVHGVGGHDHLSNLLRTYQSFRANLESVEAPIEGEDQIPGWRLTRFEEGATPPMLCLEPRIPPPEGGVGAVRMYEVNYAGFAAVVRRNQPLDLTGLFVGLDLAVCAARQRARSARDPVFNADTGAIAACLQRVTGVFTAGTVPIIGLPALVFRDYIGTFVALFTRFFEDIATFVLDKNGEQLISAHLDRTIATIASGMKDGDRLVVAAHSLGSVVLHNYVVREWTRGASRIPDTVITFGSPIGLLIWIWLFLDFEDMNFQRPISADRYFCWNPVSRGDKPRPKVSWINVANSVDPIATVFPVDALDLSAPTATIAEALSGGGIEHRYMGEARVGRVGGAHGEYLNDKQGFLRILLRAVALASGRPDDVPNVRPRDRHWSSSRSVLLHLQWLLFATATAAIGVYFALVSAGVNDERKWWFAAAYLFPPITIGVLTFFQRLLLGGPTKRITSTLIRTMRVDLVSLPYRIRGALLRSPEVPADVDPMAPSASYLARLAANVVSFVPTAAAMAAPLLWIAWLTNQWPMWPSSLGDLLSLKAVGVLTAFMAYVIASAAFEIVRTWRRLVLLLTSAQRKL
jgi:hypothetical protein